MRRGVSSFGVAIGLASALSACASLVQPNAPLAPLTAAFTAPVDQLRASAAANQPEALYALSFLTDFGLRGVEADPALAAELQARAAVPQRTTITQYIPGINGAPGRTVPLSVSRGGVSPERARLLDTCGVAALMPGPTPLDMLCGPPAGLAALRQTAAASGLSLDRPVPSESVALDTVRDCAAIDPLWTQIVGQFQAGTLDPARAGLDHIIGLCGTDEPSWQPRTMRALIAIQDGDPDAALDILQPVPRPAPGVVGPYAGFVAMQAQGARGDTAAYARERDGLLNASLAAISAEPGVTPALAPVGLRDGTLHVLRRPVTLFAGLESELTALFLPSADDAAPVTYYLNVRADPLGGDGRFYILDEYRCDGRAAIQYFEPGRAAPGVEEVVDLIRRRREGEVTPASGSEWNRGLNACQFPRFVTPGLYRDPPATP